MKTPKEIIDDNTFVKDGLITVETAIKCMEQYAEKQVKSALAPVSLDEQSEATICALCNGDGEIMFGTTPLVCNCVYRACKL